VSTSRRRCFNETFVGTGALDKSPAPVHERRVGYALSEFPDATTLEAYILPMDIRLTYRPGDSLLTGYHRAPSGPENDLSSLPKERTWTCRCNHRTPLQQFSDDTNQLSATGFPVQSFKYASEEIKQLQHLFHRQDHLRARSHHVTQPQTCKGLLVHACR